MKKIATIKTTCYCFRLMFESSGWAFIMHLMVSTIITLYALFNVNVLKIIIDALTKASVEPKQIYIYVGIYILLLVLMETLNGIQKILWDYTYDKARNLFVERVYGKLINMPMEYVDSDKGRDDVDDVVWMADQVANIAYDIWGCIAMIINFLLAFFTLANFNLIYTIVALLLIVPSIMGNLVFTRKADKLRREKAPDARKIRYYRWMLTDSAAAKDVRMYNIADDIKLRFEEEKKIYLDSYKELDWKRMVTLSVSGILKYGGEIIFSTMVIWMAVHGQITIGQLTLYIGYIAIVSQSFQNIVGSCSNIKFNLNKQMERVFEYFQRPNGLENSCGIRKLQEFKSLEFDDVYFKYPTADEYVLKGISFVINKGDRVSLIGVNGSGKSTIIKIILGLYEIQSGTVRINGYPLQEYDIHDVRKMFSVLFQSFAQYSFTVREVIGFSDLNRISDEKGMKEAMEESGFTMPADKFNKGMDTYITKKFDDRGVELSIGQHQKLALCRTYFKNAPFLIFDEPSAALDAKAEEQIFQNIEKLSQDKTSIMISHRISGSRKANKILVLDQGVIAESGTHDELVIKQNGIYSAMYTIQKKKYAID